MLSAEASRGLWGRWGGPHQPPKAARLLHQSQRHIFSLGTLRWSCPSPTLIPALPAVEQAAGGWDPPAARPAGPASPRTPPAQAWGWSCRGGLLPARAGACRAAASGRASASSHRLPQHFAWCLPWLCLPGEFRRLLTVGFLPFGLNFCRLPRAVPSSHPARASSSPGAWAAQCEHGAWRLPLCIFQRCRSARRRPAPWPDPDGALLASSAYNEEENALPRGCLALAVLDSAP